MNRPLLRARLRNRIAHAHKNGEDEACAMCLGSDAIADRVLDRLSAEHGSGGLLDLLLAIDWVKLLEVILAVVALFKSEPPRDEATIAANLEAYKRGDYVELREFVDELKTKAEAKRLADIDGETA